MKHYNISGIPLWKVYILTSVLEEYGLVSTVTRDHLEIEGASSQFDAGVPVAELKSNINTSLLWTKTEW